MSIKITMLFALLVLVACANKDPTMSGVKTLQQVGGDIATQDEKQ